MHKAIGYLRKLAPWAILAFTVGAGMATAVSIYQSAGGGLPASDASGEILGDVMAAEPSLFEAVIANIGALGFALACGGTLLVNLLLSHRLLTWIEANLREITEKSAKASAAKKEIQQIRACDQAANTLFERYRNELTSLGWRTSHDICVANEILVAIGRAVGAYETWLTDRAVRTQNAENRFAGLHDDLNAEEIRKRVAALRAITFDDIHKHVRGEGPIAAGGYRANIH